MIHKIVCVVVVLVFFSATAAEAQTATAIVSARVIDGTGAPARVETVVLLGDRILAVSFNAEISPGTSV
jgi:hypothetical protein